MHAIFGDLPTPGVLFLGVGLDLSTGSPAPPQFVGMTPQCTSTSPSAPLLPSAARPTFEAIYKEWFGYVHTVVKRRVPPHDVEDMVQQIFAGIARGLPKFDPALPFKPWLNTIIVRTLVPYFSRNAHRTAAVKALAELPHDVAPCIEERFVALELVPVALECLNERQREIVVRHLRDDESVEVIAKDMGLSERGGYKLLEAARAKLDGFVKRYYAIERRLLGEQSAFLLPLKLVFHPQAWIARARSAVGRAFTSVKGASVRVVAGAGLAVACGAWMVPETQATAPVEDVTAEIAAAVTAAPVLPVATEAPGSPGISAPQPAPVDAEPRRSAAQSTKRVAGRASGVSKDRDIDPEQRSLNEIQILLNTDPAAAVAALELHKKTFPHELRNMDRIGIEERVKTAIAARR
jgi:RNA polymerase sigma-70 factor, ECF subfamily